MFQTKMGIQLSIALALITSSCGGLKSTMDATQQMPGKMDAMNSKMDKSQDSLNIVDHGTYLQILDGALVDMDRPEATKDLTVPSPVMWRGAKTFAEEATPRDILIWLEGTVAELLTNSYESFLNNQGKTSNDLANERKAITDQIAVISAQASPTPATQAQSQALNAQLNQFDDKLENLKALYDHQKGIILIQLLCVATRVPQDSIETIVDYSLNQGNGYEAQTLALLALRVTGIAQYVLSDQAFGLVGGLKDPGAALDAFNAASAVDYIARLPQVKSIVFNTGAVDGQDVGPAFQTSKYSSFDNGEFRARDVKPADLYDLVTAHLATDLDPQYDPNTKTGTVDKTGVQAIQKIESEIQTAEKYWKK